jgi:hypothetical protein
MTTTAVCPPHHWDCDGPQGPQSKAVCKKCGEEKKFNNFLSAEAAELLDANPTDPQMSLKRGEPMGKGGDTRDKALENEARWPEIVKVIQQSPNLNQAARTLKMPASSLRQILRRKGLSNRGLPLQHSDDERMLGVDFPGERRPAIIRKVSVKTARQGELLIHPGAPAVSLKARSREIDLRWPEIQAELEKSKNLNSTASNLGLCYASIVSCCKRHGVDHKQYGRHKKTPASQFTSLLHEVIPAADSWLDETMGLLVELGAEKSRLQAEIEGIDLKIAGAKALIKQRRIRDGQAP